MTRVAAIIRRAHFSGEDRDRLDGVRKAVNSSLSQAVNSSNVRRVVITNFSDSGGMPSTFEIRPALLAAKSIEHRRHTRISPQRLTEIAVLIAGRQRAAVCGEWQSHLAGETGTGLPESRQVREAAGFVLAAIRYRLQDLADLLWRPVDALLASRELSSLFVLLATLCVSLFFIREGRLYGLAEHLEDVAVVAGFAYWLIRAGRGWRDVKPPERKPRRKSE